VDIQKMKQAKRITGSQYLTKSRLELICPDTFCKLQFNLPRQNKKGTPTPDVPLLSPSILRIFLLLPFRQDDRFLTRLSYPHLHDRLCRNIN
jgi:hypothetical protein